MFNTPRRQRQFNQREPMRANTTLYMKQDTNNAFTNIKNKGQSTLKQLVNKQNITNLAQNSIYDINKTLTNVQKVVKVVGSATPMIQEYAPMVKNLPAMYRMMKAFNQIDDEEPAKQSTTQKIDHSSSDDQIKNSSYSKQSTPKLFF